MRHAMVSKALKPAMALVQEVAELFSSGSPAVLDWREMMVCLRVVSNPFALPHEHLRWCFLLYASDGVLHATNIPPMQVFTPHLAYLRDARGRLDPSLRPTDGSTGPRVHWPGQDPHRFIRVRRPYPPVTLQSDLLPSVMACVAGTPPQAEELVAKTIETSTMPFLPRLQSSDLRYLLPSSRSLRNDVLRRWGRAYRLSSHVSDLLKGGPGVPFIAANGDDPGGALAASLEDVEQVQNVLDAEGFTEAWGPGGGPGAMDHQDLLRLLGRVRVEHPEWHPMRVYDDMEAAVLPCVCRGVSRGGAFTAAHTHLLLPCFLLCVAALQL